MARGASRLGCFQREARFVAAPNHPNIVTLGSIEEVNGIPFPTMEFVEGKALNQLIPEASFPLDQTLRIAAEIAKPLAEAASLAASGRDSIRAPRAGVMRPPSVKRRGVHHIVYLIIKAGLKCTPKRLPIYIRSRSGHAPLSPGLP